MDVLEGVGVLHLAGVEANHADLVVGRRHNFILHHALSYFERNAKTRRLFFVVFILFVAFLLSSSSSSSGLGGVAHHEGLDVDEKDDIIAHVLKGFARGRFLGGFVV